MERIFDEMRRNARDGYGTCLGSKSARMLNMLESRVDKFVKYAKLDLKLNVIDEAKFDEEIAMSEIMYRSIRNAREYKAKWGF